MFALEIDFHDGISPPETILVRRSNAIVGSSDLAHVVIDGAATSHCELRLVRGLGREFSCFPVRRPGHATTPPPFLEGTYSSEVEIKLGELSFFVTALDIDLMLLPDEFPDKGALRILRSALRAKSPLFPAVAVFGTKPIFVSFPPNEALLIGRSRRCGLRLDAPDVSSEHARIGVENGRAWVEDLGSTNGTLIGDQRIAGRRYLSAGERISIGSEFVLAPVLGIEDISGINSIGNDNYEPSETPKFPCLVASGAEIRPSRLVLKEGETLSIGRDPACDIWINAAHISRNHVVLFCGPGLSLGVSDNSSNGTFYLDERLPRSNLLSLPRNFVELDLSEGVKLAVCYSEEEERRFLYGMTPAEEFNEEEANSTPSEQFPDITRTAIPAYRDEESLGAFQRFAEKQRKQAHPGEQPASEYIDFSERGNFSGSSFGEQATLARDGNGADDEFDVDPEAFAGSQPRQVELFSQEAIDDELLRTPYFQGVRRGLLGTLLAIVVIIILLLFITIFSER